MKGRERGKKFARRKKRRRNKSREKRLQNAREE